MARFVHITTQRDARRIGRSGIRVGRIGDPIASGLYAMPVTPNFVVTHQWVREVKRWAAQDRMAGVYFTVPDDTTGWVGHYHGPHTRMSAAEAHRLVMSAGDTALGMEVLLGEPIDAAAITAIRSVPAIGWRHYPTAHGRRPCGCDSCQRGGYGTRRIRERN